MFEILFGTAVVAWFSGLLMVAGGVALGMLAAWMMRAFWRWTEEAFLRLQWWLRL